MPGKNRTVTMTYAALMTALAIILSYFPEIPLAFFAPWLKLDFSFTPLLLLGFSCGPVMLMIALLITNAVHILGGTTGMVGELANLIVGIAFLMPPTLIYQKSRTRRSACGACSRAATKPLRRRCVRCLRHAPATRACRPRWLPWHGPSGR